MLDPKHNKTLNKVIAGAKAGKVITNLLGTSPTETPDVEYKKENTSKFKGKGDKKKNKPKAGTPGTTVDVQLDENGYQTDY